MPCLISSHPVRSRALVAEARFATVCQMQQLPELLPFLKVAIDANRSQKGRFVLTGSQQFALMQGVSESLAGRIATLDLLPLGRARPEYAFALDRELPPHLS